MQIIRGLDGLCGLEPAAISIGNFDGMHMAHQKIINKLKEKATELNLKSVVISFYPHPSYFFNNKIPLLNSFREKVKNLESLGVDTLVLINFNKKFANISATDFIEQILFKKLNTKYIVVGDDFNFGKNKLGDFSLLKKYMPSTQITTQIINKYRVSSSNIRKLLQQHDITKANHLLGYQYYLSGRVIKGKMLGDTIGFATANINIKNRNLAISGVWAATVETKDKRYEGIVNIGFKPTVNKHKRLSVEAHIFDFNKNIYDAFIKIYPVFRVRGEKKFNSLEELSVQIKKDVLVAKNRV